MKTIETISLFLLWIGMLALMIMMIFVDVDIIARYFFSKPIPGSTELVSMLLVITSFFPLALCQFLKRHITITVVIDMLKPKIRIYVDAIIALLSAAFTFFIIWQTYKQGVSDLRSHAVTSIMQIHVAPFRFAAAFASVFLFLAFISDFIQALSTTRRGLNPGKSESSS